MAHYGRQTQPTKVRVRQNVCLRACIRFKFCQVSAKVTCHSSILIFGNVSDLHRQNLTVVIRSVRGLLQCNFCCSDALLMNAASTPEGS